MMDFKTDILPILPQIILGITVLICFLNYKRFPKYFELFTYYWLLIFVGELVGHALRARGIHNLWIYNLTFAASYLFIPWFITQFPGSGNLKKYLNWYFISFVILLIFDIINRNYFKDPSSILLTTTIVFGGVIIVALCAWYLWKIYKSEEVQSLQSDPHFWITTGFLAYYAALTPYLGMLNYLYQNYPEFTTVYHYIVTYGFAAILNFTICVAFLCKTANSRK